MQDELQLVEMNDRQVLYNAEPPGATGNFQDLRKKQWNLISLNK
jgi:hypothetical protein